MTDIAVTAANVVPSSQAVIKSGTAGGTVTAGQTIYKDTDGRLKQGDANASATTGAIIGVSVSGASAGQPLFYTDFDPDFTPGATVTKGTVYVASETAAGIAPVADLASGWHVTIIGVGKASNKMYLKIVASGIEV